MFLKLYWCVASLSLWVTFDRIENSRPPIRLKASIHGSNFARLLLNQPKFKPWAAMQALPGSTKVNLKFHWANDCILSDASTGWQYHCTQAVLIQKPAVEVPPSMRMQLTKVVATFGWYDDVKITLFFYIIQFYLKLEVPGLVVDTKHCSLGGWWSICYPAIEKWAEGD